MRATGGASRRYAHALLDVAQAKGDPGKLRQDLDALVALLRGNAPLASALQNPGLPAERRRAVASALFAGRVSELGQRLLELLAERGRMGLLPAIASAYAAAWNAQRGVVSASAVSAQPLDAGQTSALRAALARAAGREIELDTRVDASLLGGLVVTMEGRTYDGSVRSQLQGLRQRLVGAAF
jgi:F-type H+-transporting ATPase subunit delta